MDYKNLEDLPLVLDADTLGKILKINRNAVYQLFRSQDFPTLRIGKRLLVPKQAFVSWLDEPRVVNF